MSIVLKRIWECCGPTPWIDPPETNPILHAKFRQMLWVRRSAGLSPFGRGIAAPLETHPSHLGVMSNIVILETSHSDVESFIQITGSLESKLSMSCKVV